MDLLTDNFQGSELVFILFSTARFRWYQGFFSQDETVPHWALDNVYIGMQCRDHCGGHGTCINGMLCQCDDHYRGNECQQVHRNPTFLKDGFEGEILKSGYFGFNFEKKEDYETTFVHFELLKVNFLD